VASRGTQGEAQDLLVVTDELDSWVAGDERLLDVLVHCCSYVAGVCFANTWSPGLAASYMISLRPHHFSRICALLLHRSITFECTTSRYANDQLTLDIIFHNLNECLTDASGAEVCHRMFPLSLDPATWTPT